MTLESDESSAYCASGFGTGAFLGGFLDLTRVTRLADDEGVPLEDRRWASGCLLGVKFEGEAVDDPFLVPVSGLDLGRSVIPIVLEARDLAGDVGHIRSGRYAVSLKGTIIGCRLTRRPPSGPGAIGQCVGLSAHPGPPLGLAGHKGGCWSGQLFRSRH